MSETEKLRARVIELESAIDMARSYAQSGLSIPFYAYGDHEAACALADALNNTAALLDAVSETEDEEEATR